MIIHGGMLRVHTIYKKTNILIPYNYYIRQEIENKKTPWPIGLPYRLNIGWIFSDTAQSVYAGAARPQNSH